MSLGVLVVVCLCVLCVLIVVWLVAVFFRCCVHASLLLLLFWCACVYCAVWLVLLCFVFFVNGWLVRVVTWFAVHALLYVLLRRIIALLAIHLLFMLVFVCSCVCAFVSLSVLRVGAAFLAVLGVRVFVSVCVCVCVCCCVCVFRWFACVVVLMRFSRLSWCGVFVLLVVVVFACCALLFERVGMRVLFAYGCLRVSVCVCVGVCGLSWVFAS